MSEGNQNPPHELPPEAGPPTPNQASGELAAPPSPPPPAVLELREVLYEPDDPRFHSARNISLKVSAGELVSVKLARLRLRCPLSELALGLLTPQRGEVLFENRVWRQATAREAATARGRVGRVFMEQPWISNLNMLQNVLLPRRYHSQDPDDRISREADALARRFGLAESPRERPSLVSPERQQVAQWIRAFLIRPSLLILEDPLQSVSEESAAMFQAVVQEHRAIGAAVLWLSREEELPQFPADTRRYSLQRGALYGLS